jgi:hypothetical protein
VLISDCLPLVHADVGVIFTARFCVTAGILRNACVVAPILWLLDTGPCSPGLMATEMNRK